VLFKYIFGINKFVHACVCEEGVCEEGVCKEGVCEEGVAEPHSKLA